MRSNYGKGILMGILVAATTGLILLAGAWHDQQAAAEFSEIPDAVLEVRACQKMPGRFEISGSAMGLGQICLTACWK